MLETANIGFDPAEVSAVFPFHLAFDRESKVIQTGKVLQRLLPNLSVGDKLEDHFRFRRPKVAIDFESFCDQTDSLFILEATSSPRLVLKGQMQHLEGRDVIMFLCSPWLTDIADVGALGLTLKDFAIHDPVGDYLFLLQTQSTSLADANHLSERLAELNKQLEGRVERRTQELQSLNDALALDIRRRERAEAKAESLNAELVTVSRSAGMMEIATGVLHNVGNVLNSINVAAQILDEEIRNSKVANVGKAVQLMLEHEDDLATFLTEDDRGKKLVPYLKELSQRLDREQQGLLKEAEVLRGRVDHVKAIVRKQQRYAKMTSAIEICSVDSLIMQALDFVDASYEKHGIEKVLKCKRLPDVSVDRHQVMQILINLLSNSKHALLHADRSRKVVQVDTGLSGDEKFTITVTDNGVGILAEDINKVFTHGFTTKEDGHGFGLHTASNAAHAMGGVLSCVSKGRDQGAVFTLELPICAEGERDASDGLETVEESSKQARQERLDQ